MVMNVTSCTITHSRSVGPAEYEAVIAVNDKVPFDNETLRLDQLEMDTYMRNPVVFWAHDRRELPIARTTHISRDLDGGGIRARFRFLENDHLADRVKNAWDQGFLRGASITWATAKQQAPRLMEWSIVPIPADPEALRADMRDFMSKSLLTGGTEYDKASGGGDPGGSVDRKDLEQAVSEVLASRSAEQPGDAEAIALAVSAVVERQISEAFQRRDEALEKARAADEERAQAEQRAKDQAQEAVQAARRRANVIIAAGDLLDRSSADFDTLSDRELMVRALGDSEGDLTGKSDDYVQAVFDVAMRGRADAAAQLQGRVFAGAGEAPTGSAPRSVFDIRQLAMKDGHRA